ncbi:big defensin-like [Mytilus californianus]|uniref:big defensin-like n=1 Tax=Mytilus californianus TaxID=6549 RepID=UPI0022456847|nr:big defensin-like [Mytilus californianus]
MNKIAFLCLLYTMLLIIPGPILGKALAKTKVGKEKRTAALLPLASYAGMTVSAPVFLALVATYGIYAVISYAIRSRGDSDSHSCANNRGWCRRRCQSHEMVDLYHTDICGSYYCCRPTNL